MKDTPDMKQATSAYKDVASAPIISAARFSKNGQTITATYKQQNFIDKNWRKYQKVFSGEVAVPTAVIPDNDDAIIKTYSDCGNFRAAFYEVRSRSREAKKELVYRLEVLDLASGRMTKNLLVDPKKHNFSKIVSHQVISRFHFAFGKMCFLVEPIPSQKKSNDFLDVEARADQAQFSDAGKKKFYRESFGEQMTEDFRPILAVFDVASEEFTIHDYCEGFALSRPVLYDYQHTC